MPKTLKLSLLDIARKKRRTVISIIGIVIAITLIAGGNIFIDSTVGAGLQAKLENIPMEFYGKTDNITQDYVNISNSISAVKDVESVEPVCNIGLVDAITRRGYIKDYLILLCVRTTFEKYLHRYNLDGKIVFTEHSVILTEDTAKLLNVDVGDTIQLNHTVLNETKSFTNYSVNVKISSILKYKKTHYSKMGHVNPHEMGIIYLNLSEKDYFVNKLHLLEQRKIVIRSPYTPWLERGFTYLIYIDRDIIDPTDTKITKKRLVQLERRLESAVSQYGVTIYIYPELEYIVESYNIEITIMRVILIGFTLPLIGLGIYLGIVCIELSMSERRREIGILKSRGATNRHIFSMLLSQSILLGIIAGIVGILFGVIVSKLIMIYFGNTFLQIYAGEINIWKTKISMTSILIAIIFAIIFMIIAAYRPAKRVSNLSITESLQYYTSEEAKIPYKPTWDIIFLALGIFAYVSMVFLKYFREESPRMIFLCLLIPFLIILIPLSPFFFIFGITRLVTRTSTKIYDYCSRATKFFTKDLWSVVNKNIVRNPRRVSNVCVIIAIGVALGILISTVYGTEITSMERRIKAEIGSDISVECASGKEFKSELTKIEGVEEVAPISRVDTGFGPKENVGHSTLTGIVVLDTESYMKTAYLENYHFVKGNKEKFSELSKKGNVIVDKGFADENYYEVGDTVTVTFIHYDSEGVEHQVKKNFTIIGIVKFLPGSRGTLYADYNSIEQKYILNYSVFLVKVSKGYDPRDVSDKIEDKYGSRVVIHVYQEELEEEKSGGGMLIIDFMFMEYGFIILVVAVGLSVIIYMACVERENELANIIARGASTKQVSVLLLGEGVTIIIIGMVIGCITGFTTAYVFNELFAFFGGEMIGTLTLERTLVIPWLTPILLCVVVSALILGSFIATLRVRRLNLGRVLKRRGV